MSGREFSVVQFFLDGSWEKVREFVSAEEAVKAARHYCSSVGARLGTTVRVIIIDGGDHICFEWKFGEGVTFPLETKGFQPKTRAAP
jgi:hypothetical protein